MTIYACGADYETPVVDIEYKAPLSLASFKEVVSQEVPDSSNNMNMAELTRDQFKGVRGKSRSSLDKRHKIINKVC